VEFFQQTAKEEIKMGKQKIVAVLLVVLAFIVTVVTVRVNKKVPEKQAEIILPNVKVTEITPGWEQAVIQSTALIEANQSLQLTPEIMGKVVWVSPKVEAGGVVSRGETLIRLDSRDYQIRVTQNQVAVENAQLSIDMEQARADVAREEWQVLGDTTEASDLVLRVRQQEVAQLQLRSAESSLEKANLDLSRTSIKSPFAATIIQKNVAVGQVVSTQSPLLTLVERGELRAEISLPMADLKWIDIPGVDGADEGSVVTLTQELGANESVVRKGVIKTLVGTIDQQTRRARLIVEIPADTDQTGLPLLPGAFVTVSVEGKTVENALRIPRSAVIRGEHIWEVTADSTLNRIDLERLWANSDYFVASTDRTEPIQLAITLPGAPVNGMKVISIGGTNE